MGPLNNLPFYKRFGFRVLLIHGLLIISLGAPFWIIKKGDYKDLLDRMDQQKRLFMYIQSSVQHLPFDQWDIQSANRPQLLPGQRLLLFDDQGNLMEDSGEQISDQPLNSYSMLLPHPYRTPEIPEDPHILPETLKSIQEFRHMDFIWRRTALVNVQYSSGMDRLIVSAIELYDADDHWYLLVLTSSITDLLLQNRAVKERLLLLMILVSLMAAIQAILLSRSVTGPFRRLYHYAQQIIQDSPQSMKPPSMAETGELGQIRKAYQHLITDQHRQAEGFRHFSNDVIHELKSPLTAIRSGLELLSEEPGQEDQSRITHRLLQRLKEMESLMEDIRVLGQLKADLNKEFCRNTRETIERVHQEYRADSVQLKIKDSGSLSTVALSETKLISLLRNLVDNAISFSPQAGSVTIEVLEKPEKLIIRVEDQGPGIAEEVMNTITQRFICYRPFNREGHSGLGLAIVSTILENCKGHLHYENGTLGAIFQVELPVLSSPEPSGSTNK